MLDGRQWRFVAITKDELCDWTGLFERMKEIGHPNIKGEDILKGDALMYIPLNGKSTWHEIEPDGLLNGYFIICMGDRILARVCDGFAFELRIDGMYQPNDTNQYVFKVELDKTNITLAIDNADVRLTSSTDERADFFGKKFSYNEIETDAPTDEGRREIIQKLIAEWENVRTKTRLLGRLPEATEKQHYS